MMRHDVSAKIGRVIDLADRWIEGEPIAGLVAIGTCALAAALCPMDRFYVAVWPLSALMALTVVRMVQRWRNASP